MRPTGAQDSSLPERSQTSIGGDDAYQSAPASISKSSPRSPGILRFSSSGDQAASLGGPPPADGGAVIGWDRAVPPGGRAIPAWLRWSEEARWFAFPLVLAVVAGLAVRLAFLLRSGFPLNDGGLFYVMTQDLQRNGYALPAYTSYNHGSIPFAYPPFGFYLAGLVADLTPLDLLGVFRWLPLFFNMLTVPVVFLLARAMLGRGLAAAVAAIVFVVFPRSFLWLIVGGGVTRSAAFLFSLVALYGMYRFYRWRDWRFLPLGTVFTGLAVLTHPEVGWFTAFSIAVFFVMHGLHWKGLTGSGIAVVGVLLITAPWWLTVVSRHGMAPLLAAADTGGHKDYLEVALRTLEFRVTEEPFRDILAIFTMVGFFVSIGRLNFTLPLWLLATLFLEPRSATTYATVPMAMLTGMTVAYLIVPGVARAASFSRVPWPGGDVAPTRNRFDRLLGRAKALAPLAALGLGLLFLYGYTLVAATKASSNVMSSVSTQDLSVMYWVRDHTPPDAEFVVMTRANWPTDKVAEWFPAVTGRESVATVQGSEWTGDFGRDISTYNQLNSCGTRDAACLDNWASRRDKTFSYVYVSNGCCNEGFVRSLRNSDRYVKVYENQGAAVFARRTD